MKMLQEIMKKQDALEKENKELKQTILQQNQQINQISEVNRKRELFDNTIFTTPSNSSGSISNNRKKFTSINGRSHCYLNCMLVNGTYCFKFEYINFCESLLRGSIFLGLSTNNTYTGTNIYYQPTTCNYTNSCIAPDITEFCHIGTVVNSNPKFSYGNSSIYEMIVDMNKREFWISHNDSSPVLLVKNLPSPLYPYAEVGGNSLELLSVSHQN